MKAIGPLLVGLFIFGLFAFAEPPAPPTLEEQELMKVYHKLYGAIKENHYDDITSAWKKCEEVGLDPYCAGLAANTVKAINIIEKLGFDLAKPYQVVPIRKLHTETILYATSFDGHTDAVRYILSKDRSTINLKMGAHNRVPLHVAVIGGDWQGKKGAEIVKMLIANGAELNPQDEYGYTPLVCAVYGGDVESFKILLEAGSDITIKDNKGRELEDHLAEVAKDEWQGENARQMQKILKEYQAGKRPCECTKETQSSLSLIHSERHAVHAPPQCREHNRESKISSAALNSHERRKTKATNSLILQTTCF